MQESDLDLVGLVPGTRVDWIGKDWMLDWKEKDWTGKDWIGKN